MKKTVELDDNDWGQVIDGLECRAFDYERTARFYEANGCYDEGIEEVSSAEEAQNLADWYRRLVVDIRRQLRDE